FHAASSSSVVRLARLDGPSTRPRQHIVCPRNSTPATRARHISRIRVHHIRGSWPFSVKYDGLRRFSIGTSSASGLRIVLRTTLVFAALALSIACSGGSESSPSAGPRHVTLLHASYDPTRELFEEVNASFARH